MKRARVVAAGLLLAGLGGALLLPLGAQAAPAPAEPRGDGFKETRTVSRVFVGADGVEQTISSHTMTVTADQTRNLRGRQRILISWSGAQPSAGRASNPYGENGLNQEYPVVILQCRGVDDPDAPAAKRLTPQTCWTASVAQRSQISRSPGEASWTDDLYAGEADKQRVSGMDPFPSAEECPTADIEPYYTRLTPFVPRKGAAFPACDADSMPPEAAVGAAFPPAELAAFTDEQGKGSVQFEVRSEVENESLGCSDKVACAVVVVPILGLSCDQPEDPATLADKACRKTGRFPAGSSNFSNDGVDQAVSPALWWSESNWRNRFTIPVTFGLPPDACDVLDPRPPTGFYGSELLAQAALQWSPAYCLNKQRFKFQHNQMSDEAGFNLMESGGGAAALVSSQHPAIGGDEVGYAPTAVTGFSIGYVIDRPDNAGEYQHLRLNARLLAKLLSQSYLGSDLGRGHPGIGGNPLAIMQDPEFIRLNPGLSTNPQEVGATVLSQSNQSDVLQQLTEYIAQDKDAMDFIHGKPDPWGMRVNPKYKNISLPRPEWPLLDTYVPETENTCRQNNPAVYFSQIAAPVTTLRKISEALLDAWPNVQTRCEFDISTNQYKLGRIDRQSFGSRFMLGIVSLGDAERYGLRSAALETTKGRYVEPSDASLAAAVGLSKQAKKYQTFALDQADVARSPKAYPGTMVVYTAARLSGLDKEDAAKVAQFIRVATTEGQRQGTGNGELPEGFLPIRPSGATGKLYASAAEVADAVAEQKPPPSPDTDAPDPAAPDGGPVVTPDTTLPDPEPTTATDDDPTPPPTTADTTPVAHTEPVGSRLSELLLPALLVLGFAGAAYSLGSRFFVRPPRRPW